MTFEKELAFVGVYFKETPFSSDFQGDFVNAEWVNIYPFIDKYLDYMAPHRDGVWYNDKKTGFDYCVFFWDDGEKVYLIKKLRKLG